MQHFSACYNIPMSFWRHAQVVIIGTVILSPTLALAQVFNKAVVPCNGVNCTVCDLASLAQNILNLAIYVMIVLSAVMFAYAGFKAMTAGGNASEYAAARRIFGNVLIGLVIILSAWILIDTLMKTLVPNSSFGPWNKICETVENVFEHHYA